MNTELFHKKSKRILILMTVKKHSGVFLRNVACQKETAAEIN